MRLPSKIVMFLCTKFASFNCAAMKTGSWVNYKIGFTGIGPTAFDRVVDKPVLTKKEKRAWRIIKGTFIHEAIHESSRRQRLFCKSITEVTGEDPRTDWGWVEIPRKPEEFELE